MNLFIDRQGTGPVPLVLLHGWAMHGGVFDDLVDALRERCTLYVVDLPGHGHSRDSGLPLEPQACAWAIAEATPPAVWVGWSLGGLIAQSAGLRLPEKVRALGVLCSTPKFSRGQDWPYGSDPTLVRQLATDLETDYHATIERFLALEAMGSQDPRSELRHLRSLVFARGEPDLRILQEGIRILDETDLRQDMTALSMPTAWICGRRDRLAAPAAVAWAAEHAGGQFTQIEHAGHAPFFGHVPAVVAALEPLLEAFRE
ncbi:pimeloyl-ACP methyl ester esterase BioH [Dyella sp.]|uniref:pimeloyl-ACP methyl ester esterase BioH n=1 Tax=Dyella sp. TaxID=1869338 RepID=UPI002ED40756